MNTHITASRQFRLYGAVLAMTALLAVLLAVTLTDGPAQAQVGPGHLPRLGDNEDEYDEPYPCTEEVEAAASDVAIISDGYYAVFDGFWDYEDGHLSNNFCPPKVTSTTEYDEEKGVDVTDYTRHDANIHISKTAFSIPDSYKVTVVDSRTEVSNGNPSTVTGPTIDIADFPFLAEEGAVSAVKPGPDSTADNPTTVFANETLWWVRLDQPWTTADETSPLQIGFSTDLLEEADWYLADGNDQGTDSDPPVQFRAMAMVAETVGAHLFAFDQRATDTPLSEARWTSVDTDTNKIRMFTGQYRRMQFAFTEPGVYRVQVHVKGHVRKERNRLSSAPRDWSPISPDGTIASAVRWYTFHVGPFTLNRNPVFGIERSVPENSASGVAVGAPVPVLEHDADDTHAFNLTGNGAHLFAASRVSGGVQITVAPGATLNYEDTSSFDLNLTVSDGKGRFGNTDSSVDDSIPVRIVVEDDPNEQLAITLEADRTTQAIGQSVRLTARVHNSPVSSDRLSYRFHEQNVDEGDSLTELTHDTDRTVTWNGSPLFREYTVTVWVTDQEANGPQATSNKMVIAWTN